MAGDPRTRDPDEAMPILPDKQRADKPVGYDPDEGLRFIDAACECGGTCDCEGGRESCACDAPSLDVDPFDDVPGYYSESGDIHEELPVALASIRSYPLKDTLTGLCVEHYKAAQAFGSAVKRASIGVPVLKTFNTLRAWGTMMPDHEWTGLVRSAAKRSFHKAEGFPERLHQMFLRRANVVLACYSVPSTYAKSRVAMQIRKAVCQGSLEGVQAAVLGCREPSIEIQRAAWVLNEFGPKSRHYEGATDTLRKLKVWALPELRLIGHG